MPRSPANGPAAPHDQRDSAGSARTPLRRPALKAGLRRLWRDTTELQIGVSAPNAVVLEGIDEAGRRLVESLAGSPGKVVDPTGLLERLDELDLLDDSAIPAPALRRTPDEVRARLEPDLAAWALRGPPGHAGRLLERRARATVQVRGSGRVGALIAVLLTSAGVGSVDVVDPRLLRSADVPAQLAAPPPPVPMPDENDRAAGRESRAEATRRWCAAVGVGVPRPKRRARAAAQPRPDVVVLSPVATCGAVDPAEHGRLMRSDTPHLVVYVREGAGVVGPFVLPGRGPCLRCLELARTDRDHAWPRLLAQLVAGPAAGRTEPVDACDGVLATLVAAHATLEVLTFLDGRSPSTLATGHEMTATEPIVRLRPWAQHPACGCAWDESD